MFVCSLHFPLWSSSSSASVSLCFAHINGLMLKDKQMFIMLCKFVCVCAVGFCLNSKEWVVSMPVCMPVWFIFCYLAIYGMNAASLTVGE